MKILKKFLFVSLFSCSFLVGNAKAYTSDDFPDVSSIVGDNNYSINYIFWGENSSANKIALTYCKNGGLLTTDYTFDENNTHGGIYSCSNGVNYMRRLQLNNTTFINWNIENLLNEKFDFKNSSYSWGPELSTRNNYGTNAQYNEVEKRLYILEDLYTTGVIYSANDIYYSDATNVILSKNIFNEPPIDVTCNNKELGTIKNVSSFALNVNGISNALKEPLKGSFGIVGFGNNSLLLTNDYNIQIKEKNNKEIVGKYEFQCNDADIGNGCELKYQYSSTDDIDENLNLQFIFTSKTGSLDYGYHLLGCNYNNSIMSYTYVNKSTNNVVENPSLDNFLNDDTPPSADISILGNVQGILPEGPIDSLLTIPFKVLSILSSSFGGVCKPISFKFVFDSTLTIPCFSEMFYSNVPDSIMLFINVVPSAFILIKYFKNLYKRVDKALSLETSADDEWGGI